MSRKRQRTAQAVLFNFVSKRLSSSEISAARHYFNVGATIVSKCTEKVTFVLKRTTNGRHYKIDIYHLFGL
jgi:hypothetical protein